MVATQDKTLTTIDIPPIKYSDLPEEMKRWLAILVDTLNYDIEQIQTRLLSGGL